MSETNRQFKDRLFCFIFGREENKKWTLSLYNAINDSDFTNPDDIQIETIEGVLYMSMRDDIAFMIQDTLNLYEQQSSYNPNMPLRELMYLGKVYDKLIHRNNMNIYSEKLLILPAPRFIVFYNGTKEIEDRVLRLSDSFPKVVREKSDVEATVRMININHGQNKELMKKCKTLNEYSWFVSTVREYSSSCDIDQAVDKAINEMSEDAEIKLFLVGHRAEVKDMCLTEYDEKKHMEAVRAEGKEEGIEEGIEKINTLVIMLLRDNRIDDLKKATEDATYREELFVAYGINEKENQKSIKES
ncbi:MAG: hypothetical protein K5865_06005 [Eubacterium sp.]|nr:hypothetical protein [Eubacterium sp.]